MANLILPHRFVPGQLALASEMNANFEAIETWAGGNLGTTNITVLEARPGGGSILEFNQTANFPVLDVTNSGADTAIDITQAGLLQTGKAVIDVTDNNPQAAANTAHFRMTLSNSTDIPAIQVKHGPTQNTLTVTRTGITTDVGITTAGTLQANSLTVNSITNSQPLSLTGPLTLTAATADALALKIKGRSSDNISKIQLKNNADSTTYVEIEGSPSGVTLNLPDTADTYTFKVAGNTKAVINNSGIDGAYFTNQPIAQSYYMDTYRYSSYLQIGGFVTLSTLTFTLTKAQLGIMQVTNVGTIDGRGGISDGSPFTPPVSISPYEIGWVDLEPGPASVPIPIIAEEPTLYPNGPCYVRYVITGPSGVIYDGFDSNGSWWASYLSGASTSTLFPVKLFRPLNFPQAGTYTVQLQVSAWAQDIVFGIGNYRTYFYFP